MNQRDLMRQAQQLQARIAKVQEDLGSETVEGSVGGGAITVTMTGHLKVTAVHISPDAIDPADVEMLEELVTSAVNDAVDKAQALAQQRLGAVTGGMRIPGLM